MVKPGSDFGLVQEAAKFLLTQNFTTVSRLASTSKSVTLVSDKCTNALSVQFYICIYPIDFQNSSKTDTYASKYLLVTNIN